jgi:hypothetical protein
MPAETVLMSALFSLTSLGLMSLSWSRLGSCPVRAHRGRWLFLFLLAVLGGLCLVAAVYLPQVAILSGLVLALFLILMVWEGPATSTGEG